MTSPWDDILKLCNEVEHAVGTAIRDLGAPPPQDGWEPEHVPGRGEGSCYVFAWPDLGAAVYHAEQVSRRELELRQHQGWRLLDLAASADEVHAFLSGWATETPAGPKRLKATIAHGHLTLSQSAPEALHRAARALDLDPAELPDWLAATAAGEPPPMPLDEEVLEDLHALQALVELPQVRAPRVSVSNRGVLTATGADHFALRVRLEGSAGATSRDGAIWHDGPDTCLLPQDLRTALDAMEMGPPAGSTGERMLWWARLQDVLLRHHAELSPYLKNQRTVLVEDIHPALVPGDDGHPTVTVRAPGLSRDELTDATDRLNPRRPHDATLMVDEAEGPVRVRLVLTDASRQALARVAHLRKEQRQAAARGVPWARLPQLVDAPDTVFPSELGFDLSLYSPRVQGVDTVVYRVTVKYRPEGGTKLELTSPDAPSPQWSPAQQAELAERLRAAAQRNLPFVRFEDCWVRVPPENVADELAEQAEADAAAADAELVPAVNLENVAYSPEDTGDGEFVDFGPPPGLADNITLHAHQQEGLRWLLGHAGATPGASDHGMLADDMGLGKTLQVLSTLAHMKENNRLSPCLVVAPVALLQNWCAEADRFFPGRFTRRLILRGATPLRPKQIADHDVVLTSYETLRSQQLLLGAVHWKAMVCDESHVIRNPTAKVTRAIWSMNADVRLALTGTPIHTTLADLWAQFDWLAPGWLGDHKSFVDHFPDDDEKARSELRSRLGPRMLRRTKQVLEDRLPPKHQHRHTIPMTADQEALYEAVLASASDQRGSFGTLHRLFQVGSDPHALGLPEDEPNPKLNWLLATLENIRQKDERAIVFAEHYSTQDRLQRAIERRFSIRTERINGKVAGGRRLAIVNAFNARRGFGVLVLGPKAAGVGLNVVGANHVVHFTRHWNPALEAQATDRAYRIGQTRPVHVHLPIATHSARTSIEKHLDGLLAGRSELAGDILGWRADGITNNLAAHSLGEGKPECSHS